MCTGTPRFPPPLTDKMPSKLPQNIVERIISFVEDSETLCNCALTCRRFVSAQTRRLDLFRYISIRSRAKFDDLRTARDTSTIAPYLDVVYLEDDAERPWIHSFPFIFPAHSRCIHDLTLQNVQFDRYPLHQGSVYAFGHTLTSLTTLTIAQGKFHDFVEFQRLVGALSKLSRLTAERIGFLVPPVRLPSMLRVPPCPPLKFLWFDSTCAGTVPALVDWFLRPPVRLRALDRLEASAAYEALSSQGTAARSIHDLQLWKQAHNDLPAVQRLLHALGSVLEYFQLSLLHWTRGGALRSSFTLVLCPLIHSILIDISLDLSHNTGLKDLHVQDITPSSYLHLAAVLLSLRCPKRLTHLSLYLTLAPSGALPVPESYWVATLNSVFENTLVGLTYLVIWLLPPEHPAKEYTVDRAALTDTITSWMSSSQLQSFVSVRPWYTLVNTQRSPSLSPSPPSTSAQSPHNGSQFEQRFLP